MTAGDTVRVVTNFVDKFGNKINEATDFKGTGNVYRWALYNKHRKNPFPKYSTKTPNFVGNKAWYNWTAIVSGPHVYRAMINNRKSSCNRCL